MKEKILRILMDANEGYISGEEICNSLGVTRAAVWKHIDKIREEGYIIQSAPKKGYRLISSPDSLSEHSIRPILDTQVLGKSIRFFDSIDSTNIKAKELALSGEDEGTVVIAEEQTLGKGRLGRAWSSVKGQGIWMSIILRPNLSPVDAPKITQLAALGVTAAIEKTLGIKPLIKWPNDIVVEGKKVCGILTEMGADMDTIDYIILGIGINVNHSEQDFDDDISNKASSLSIIKGNKIQRKELLKALLEELEGIYLGFKNQGSLEGILQKLIDYSATIGREVRIIRGDQTSLAKAVSIDKDGSLVVEYENGQREHIISGEVSVRGINGYV